MTITDFREDYIYAYKNRYYDQDYDTYELEYILVTKADFTLDMFPVQTTVLMSTNEETEVTKRNWDYDINIPDDDILRVGHKRDFSFLFKEDFED
jgi:hypothetical protein